MSDQNASPDTQETEKGLTIPVPRREDVEKGLDRLIAPLPRRSGDDDCADGEDGPLKE